MITINLMKNAPVAHFGGQMVSRMVNASVMRTCSRIAAHVMREAKANAPVSPTQAEIDEERERKKKERMAKVAARRKAKAEAKAAERAKKAAERAAKAAKSSQKKTKKRDTEAAEKTTRKRSAKKTGAARRKLEKTRKPKPTRRRAKNRPVPGGLERSINAVAEMGANGAQVAVYVRDPSEATKYADFIHNQKGVKWRNRGIGTRNKGQRADDKFIERAVHQNEAAYFNLIKRAVDDTVRTDRG